jgi:hypothetical protein
VATPSPRKLVAIAGVALCASALCVTAASAQPPAPGVAVPPWIHQVGTTFVNSKGRQVLLRGVNATPDASMDFGSVAAMKANLVRIPIKWSLIEPAAPVGTTHTYDPVRLAQLDTEVAYFRAHSINVLLDFHQSGWSSYFAKADAANPPNANDSAGIPSWLYVGSQYTPNSKGRAAALQAFYTDPNTIAQFESFVKMIVDRYRTSPNVVGYEILNEPQTGSLLPSNHATTQLVIGWEAQILKLIRAEDPLRTVFFMLRGGGDLGITHSDLTALHPLTNLALDLHDYFAGNAGSGYSVDGENRSSTFIRTADVPTYTGTLASQTAYLNTVLARTRKWNIPLLVGEWGVRRDDPNRLAYQSQMLSLFGALRLNWTRWNLDRDHQYGILNLKGGLSDVGLQLSKYLHTVPALVPLGVATAKTTAKT